MVSRIVPVLLREPLLHFLVLGGVLFALYVAFGKPGDAALHDRIVVDEQQLSRLSQQFQRTWMRAPTRDELRALADDFVKEEILYREALALGLDRDDLVIRRRMRQKMEFLNADLNEQEPTDADLEAYLRANPETFRQPSRFSFQQVYLDPKRTDGDVLQRAQGLLAALRANTDKPADPASLGDPSLLPAVLERATPRDVANMFGPEFAEAVAGAPTDMWSGPHTSTYGLHLLNVTEHLPGKIPPLTSVRSVVAREWANERRHEAEARFYETLRSRYSIEIRWPEDTQDDVPARSDQLAARP
jgi:parvulin-like peptidyl-prolyl isomerase